MQKIPIKYLQAKFNNILIRSYIVYQVGFIPDARMVQHMQVDKHNSAYKQM
jgi:hypothetical protein